MRRLVAHPLDSFRVGDFLISGLQDPKWTEFRAAVAFVKKSGTRFIAPHLATFAKRSGSVVNISIGVDFGGSSLEGVKELVDAVAGMGKLWVYRNASNTFHPKVFLFRNATAADLVVGSGNLTKGGLFENSEAFIRNILDLSNADDAAFLTAIETMLDRWAVSTPNVCLPVDHSTLSLLHASGDLPTEAQARSAVKTALAKIKVGKKASKSPFKGIGFPKAPSAPVVAAVSATPLPPAAGTSPPSAAAASTATVSKGQTFGMTLQNTDVSVGQRSPEVFIPLKALDQLPSFWNWKSQSKAGATYKIDAKWRAEKSAWIKKESARKGRIPRPLDKLDWPKVRINLVGHPKPLSATIWFNPLKKDLRIREENIRSAGAVGDILLVRRAPLGSAHDYEMEIVKPTNAIFAATLAKLTTKVQGSKKVIGYF